MTAGINSIPLDQIQRTVIENMSGKILAAIRPIINIRDMAMTGVKEKLKARMVTAVPIAEKMKNFFGDILVSIRAPRNVPAIFPRK